MASRYIERTQTLIRITKRWHINGKINARPSSATISRFFSSLIWSSDGVKRKKKRKKTSPRGGGIENQSRLPIRSPLKKKTKKPNRVVKANKKKWELHRKNEKKNKEIHHEWADDYTGRAKSFDRWNPIRKTGSTPLLIPTNHEKISVL